MRKKVLVVDDNESIRLLLTDILSSDYDVDSAKDGTEALEKLAEVDFDLVYTDLSLPGTHGIDLIKNAKEGGSTADFVILTGYGTTYSSVEARKVGAADYLTKPIDAHQILDIAKRLTGTVDESQTNGLQRNEQGLEAKVLVVDDDADYRSVMRRILEQEGYTVDEAGTVKDALTKLTPGDYDIAVVDIVMCRTQDGVEMRRHREGIELLRDINYTGGIET
jgi:DNA-binding NtrC family response regulator